MIPCYNEGSAGDDCIRKTAPVFLKTLAGLVESGKCSESSRICFVDDGSKDDTWSIIQELSISNPHVTGIRLSRNFGHQGALLAGLMEARGKCDLTISMDCDGQDDPAVAEQMVDAFEQGYDVAYGVRSSRETDTWFKRVTAESFYKLMSSMGVETVFNHADYRMLSNRALDSLAEFREVNLFLRGMVPLVGYPSTTIEYARAERTAGESHYPLRKMISLALNGITSLSIKPIRIISAIGIAFSLLGVVGLCWGIVSVILGHAVAGWASTISVICVLGGLQLLSLGVIGEYVGKIYLETKRRPRFIVSERTSRTDEQG